MGVEICASFYTTCVTLGRSGWVIGTAGPCLFRTPVRFTDLALFFKDSAHGKHMSLEKDYGARKVYEGKA